MIPIIQNSRKYKEIRPVVPWGWGEQDLVGEGELEVSIIKRQASQVVLVVKNLLVNAGDVSDAGLIPG